MARSVLAIAVAAGGAAYVFLSDGQLQDWGTTVKHAKTGGDHIGFAQARISELQPEIVVTEDISAAQCRKGERVKRIISDLAALASYNGVLDVSVPRQRTYPSKYEEAAYLIAVHPELAGYLPKQKRRIFDFEPRGMIVFEALVLAKGACCKKAN